jgi:hypothetical protein
MNPQEKKDQSASEIGKFLPYPSEKMLRNGFLTPPPQKFSSTLNGMAPCSKHFNRLSGSSDTNYGGLL